jgi:hypothetical protein
MVNEMLHEYRYVITIFGHASSILKAPVLPLAEAIHDRDS